MVRKRGLKKEWERRTHRSDRDVTRTTEKSRVGRCGGYLFTVSVLILQRMPSLEARGGKEIVVPRD